MRTSRLLPFALLVAAALLLLPLVYVVVARGPDHAPLALSLGLLSMGLAWSAGCSLEDRRRGTVRAIGAAGVLVPLLAAAGVLSEFAALERALLLGCSVLSAAGLGMLVMRWRGASSTAPA